MLAAERFERAAVLGVAMAEEMRRLLRLHLVPADRAKDGAIVIDVPYPDAAVVTAVLDVAADCFGERGATLEETRQAALEKLLQLAGFDAESQLNLAGAVARDRAGKAARDRADRFADRAGWSRL
ncbi:hypothetical protein MTP10_16915 [Nonomuraea sp. 3-1Str]|uniref:hypothetical protein n=1 Tax=Nonomuraea sp. 3-1Str TaxID=2929801 RepID=UPI00285B4DC0|nr:hypothetical protein [Nonomuraea sp. 3-1Str]MDR8410411.1 hypothetical protein [Nonomuraea sp. 3-1Str]